MRCSDKTSISWSLEVEDDVLDALRFLFEKGVVSDNFVKRYLNPEIDDGEDMRFRIKQCGYGWEIEDTFDKESPMNGLGYVSWNGVKRARDWLNKNVTELPFHMKVEKIINELWDDDEIVVDDYMGSFVITEIKPTAVKADDIYELLKEVTVDYYMITRDKAVYKINKE